MNFQLHVHRVSGKLVENSESQLISLLLQAAFSLYLSVKRTIRQNTSPRKQRRAT